MDESAVALICWDVIGYWLRVPNCESRASVLRNLLEVVPLLYRVAISSIDWMQLFMLEW